MCITFHGFSSSGAAGGSGKPPEEAGSIPASNTPSSSLISGNSTASCPENGADDHVLARVTADEGAQASSGIAETSTSSKLKTSRESDSTLSASKTADGTSNDADPSSSVYHIKWIKFRGDLTPVVTQNENGPCPLLAIMNVLLLKGKVRLPPMVEMVTAGQLMEYLADCIFEHAPKVIIP